MSLGQEAYRSNQLGIAGVPVTQAHDAAKRVHVQQLLYHSGPLTPKAVTR